RNRQTRFLCMNLLLQGESTMNSPTIIQPKKGYKGMAMEGFIARWYDKSTGKNLDRIHAMARRVTANAPTGSRILEVAPGPGYLSIELAQTGRYKVTGMDVSKTFVQIATEHARAAGAPVTFQEGEAAHMPFEGNTFDFIV